MARSIHGLIGGIFSVFRLTGMVCLKACGHAWNVAINTRLLPTEQPAQMCAFAMPPCVKPATSNDRRLP